MTGNTYTLEFSGENINAVKHSYSPSAILISVLCYSISVSISTSIYALIIASFLPFKLIFEKKIFFHNLSKLNLINIFMIITLSLTWPEIKSGFLTGILIAVRINMIYIAFTAVIYPLGTSGMYNALCGLGVPEKMRVLIILTLRGIYIMYERLEAALISVKLRTSNLHGIMKLRVFAYLTASVLLQSSIRSENIMRSVKCKGGFNGFNQYENKGITAADTAFIFIFILYSLSIIIINYA